jgi:glucose-6-phosphate 1-dehydrogenase
MNKELNYFTLVIFGGDGDLAMRKIFPALYYRLKDGQVSPDSRILVVSRNDRSSESFLVFLTEELSHYISKFDEKVLGQLTTMTKYVKADLSVAADYSKIKQAFSDDKNLSPIYYFSTPSSLFSVISAQLSQNGMLNNDSKVVLEKPLGANLQTFEELNSEVRKYFKEEQIYRIDHYLGKETVQNLMVMRFANHLFELAWNAQNVDNIQITVAEALGVESRKDFYDQYGALKDMVQNHLLQLLCLVAMEPPAKLHPDSVRDEKLKVLRSLRFYNSNNIEKDTVKAQYTRGEVGGEDVRSYQEDIDRYDSATETFVALCVHVDNWRWAGVPFYLRTGKRMTSRYSEIVINFKRVPHNIFPAGRKIDRNKLIIRLQPDEHIELVQMVKVPGPGGYRYKPIALKLDYGASFSKRLPEAYERLLMDIVRGDQTLFMREDEVRASWNWIHSITDNWEKTKQGLGLYKSGTMGPGNEVLKSDHYWNAPNIIDNGKEGI